LVQLADLELEVNAHRGVDLQLHAFTQDLLETLELGLDSVGAVLEARENVVPGLVGCDGPADVGLGLTRGDGRAGNGGAGWIGDVAEQRARDGPRPPMWRAGQ